MAKIIIPTPLRKFTDQNRSFETDKKTVSDSIKDLTDSYPDIKKNILDEDGNIRSYVKVYIGDDEISTLQNGDTPVEDDTVISIVPAIAGGCQVQMQ